MRRVFKPQILIGIALIAIVAYVVFSQGRQGDAPRDRSFNQQDFMRIAESDRSLPGLDEGSGSEAFRETVDASAGTSITYEIPSGMTIQVSWEIQGGSVHLMLDPVWTDPQIVELDEGSSTKALITNDSDNPGRINIRSTPIGDVEGSFTLYAE